MYFIGNCENRLGLRRVFPRLYKNEKNLNILKIPRSRQNRNPPQNPKILSKQKFSSKSQDPVKTEILLKILKSCQNRNSPQNPKILSKPVIPSPFSFLLTKFYQRLNSIKVPSVCLPAYNFCDRIRVFKVNYYQNPKDAQAPSDKKKN